MTGGGSGGAEDPKGMRERLLDGAFDLFMRQGFQRTSVAEIVAAAGATKGAFYHYFGSKDDLLVNAHIEYLEAQLAELREVEEGGAPADERLRQLVLRMVRGVYRYPAHVTLFVEERRSIRPETAQRAYGLRSEIEGKFVAFVQAGIDDRVFRQDMSARTIALGLSGMLTWTFTWTPRRSPEEVEEIAKQLADMTLGGVLAARAG